MARFIDFLKVAPRSQDRFALPSGAGDDLAEGTGHERVSPKLELPLPSHAIGRGDIDPVGHGMSALDQLPGGLLGAGHCFRLGGQPADRGRVEENLGAGQGGETRRFREPLVPADQHADLRVARFKARKPQVSRGEIELLVVAGIIGNVHLAVFPRDRAVRVDHRRGVVIDSGGALLENGSDDDDSLLPRQPAQGLRGRSGDRLRQPKILGILALWEIAREKELLKANDLSPFSGGRSDPRRRLGEIRLWIRRRAHLNKSDGDLFFGFLAGHFSGPRGFSL